MKGLIAALFGVVTTTVAGAVDLPVAVPREAASPNVPPWTLTVSSEVRYFSWKSDRGYPPGSALADFRGRGSQIYIPFAAQLAGQPHNDFKVEFLGRGGWVRSRQTTFGLTGEVETITDTVASGTVTYLGFNGVQPFASVNFNFPTGKSALSGSERNARMDSDLVDIASFGEGFNVGPTIGFSVPITENLIATISAGYTRRGAFTREGSPSPSDPSAQAPVQLDPGEVITGTASIGYQIGQLVGSITGSISGETDTTVDSAPLFRPGRRYLISGSWAYTWPERWGVTTLTASAAHSKKNKVLFVNMATLDPVTFDTEPFNSNSNLYRVGLEHLFPFGQLWIGPTGSFLNRDHNGYDSNTLQFVPAKERWSAGLLAHYAASDRVSFNARAEHVWTRQDDNSGDAKLSLLLVPPSTLPIPGVPPISSTGWQVVVGATGRI